MKLKQEMSKAVAVLDSEAVKVIVLFTQEGPDVRVDISVKIVPPGNHGLHIHRGGDMREGCKSLCDHWSLTKGPHGGPPPFWHEDRSIDMGPRHTGDLGNINNSSKKRLSYRLVNVTLADLQGRSVIVHDSPDDEGRGPFDDSLITGHAGNRIACGVIGRACSK